MWIKIVQCLIVAFTNYVYLSLLCKVLLEPWLKYLNQKLLYPLVIRWFHYRSRFDIIVLRSDLIFWLPTQLLHSHRLFFLCYLLLLQVCLLLKCCRRGLVWFKDDSKLFRLLIFYFWRIENYSVYTLMIFYQMKSNTNKCHYKITVS